MPTYVWVIKGYITGDQETQEEWIVGACLEPAEAPVWRDRLQIAADNLRKEYQYWAANRFLQNMQGTVYEKFDQTGRIVKDYPLDPHLVYVDLYYVVHYRIVEVKELRGA